MNCSEPWTKNLAALHEMSQVRQTIVLARITGTIRVGRRHIVDILGVAILDRAPRSEHLPVARVARWDYAVEHVDAT